MLQNVQNHGEYKKILAESIKPCCRYVCKKGRRKRTIAHLLKLLTGEEKKEEKCKMEPFKYCAKVAKVLFLSQVLSQFFALSQILSQGGQSGTCHQVRAPRPLSVIPR